MIYSTDSDFKSNDYAEDDHSNFEIAFDLENDFLNADVDECESDLYVKQAAMVTPQTEQLDSEVKGIYFT
jgi:hypothetical protein